MVWSRRVIEGDSFSGAKQGHGSVWIGSRDVHVGGWGVGGGWGGLNVGRLRLRLVRENNENHCPLITMGIRLGLKIDNKIEF